MTVLGSILFDSNALSDDIHPQAYHHPDTNQDTIKPVETKWAASGFRDVAGSDEWSVAKGEITVKQSGQIRLADAYISDNLACLLNWSFDKWRQVSLQCSSLLAER